jgi:hypothetical protein
MNAAIARNGIARALSGKAYTVFPPESAINKK